MKKYLMEVKPYFGVCEQFIVEATNKSETIEKAKEYAEKHIYWGGNYDRTTLRCVKKITRQTLISR